MKMSSDTFQCDELDGYDALDEDGTLLVDYIHHKWKRLQYFFIGLIEKKEIAQLCLERLKKQPSNGCVNR